ncbi:MULTISPECIES: response regulator transcription factor [Spirosoma]|uniref:Response regulator transcription factor n=1 Tax=Spirosoma liriopis TaxID=2937440 RepID=A0ABT0HFG5_9BACT|nr:MULTISPECIES: response regulator transcription factor [Spirosoma]MCK8490891.1 response regulator transcription factor [Spirosoma liriopis]UHG93706.1 response regulator transcription factor [Spirosoma oryzicola]
MLVDDHSIVRDGIRLLLEQADGLEIIDEANDGEEALEKLKTHQPDLVLMDISLPGMSGIQTTQVISRLYKSVRVLMLSMHNNEDYILRSVEAGAYGYILKDSSSDEMIKAIRMIAGGEKYYSSPVASIILSGYMQQLKKGSKQGREVQPSRLSNKEKEILQFLVDGMSSREIAERLQLSVRTVDNHRANMMRRLQVRNAAELVRIAVEEKLI